MALLNEESRQFYKEHKDRQDASFVNAAVLIRIEIDKKLKWAEKKEKELQSMVNRMNTHQVNEYRKRTE